VRSFISSCRAGVLRFHWAWCGQEKKLEINKITVALSSSSFRTFPVLPGRCPGLYGISGVRGQGGVDWSYPHPWGGRDVEVGRCGGFEAITSNLSQDAFAGPCRLAPLSDTLGGDVVQAKKRTTQPSRLSCPSVASEGVARRCKSCVISIASVWWRVRLPAARRRDG